MGKNIRKQCRGCNAASVVSTRFYELKKKGVKLFCGKYEFKGKWYNESKFICSTHYSSYKVSKIQKIKKRSSSRLNSTLKNVVQVEKEKTKKKKWEEGSVS